MSLRVIDVPLAPQELPPVAPSELLQAWHAATVAAELGIDGGLDEAAGVRFRCQPGGPAGSDADTAEDGSVDILFADLDAQCWICAIERHFGLGDAHGLALCFRFLGMIEVMAEAPWARDLFDLDGSGSLDVHPALLRVAASMPLGPDARFDRERFRLALGRHGRARLH